MVSDYDAARLLWLRAGWLKNEGRRNTRETSLAKWFATVKSERAAADAVQIHGANGYSDEYPVGRFYRNCKAAVIYEGSREIHKLMQADYALGYRQDKPRRVELPAYALSRGPSPRPRSAPPAPWPVALSRYHARKRSQAPGGAAMIPADLPLEFVQGRRARGHRRGPHHGPGRPQGRRPAWPSRPCATRWRPSTSTAPSSSARASATRRPCSTSARRSGTGTGAGGRHRGRPARGHEPLRHRRPERDRRPGRRRAGRAAPRARHLHGQARGAGPGPGPGRHRRAGRATT